jgi:Tol biopolymer transport system component
LIGVEVFDKSAGYDTSLDSTVRTEATKLRSKLREYYTGLGNDDQILIEIPKGSYVPSFGLKPEPVVPAPPAAADTSSWRGHRLLGFGLAAGLLLAFVIAEAAAYLRDAWSPRVEAEVVPLTTTPEDEYPPSLSPDGTKVTYAAGDEKLGKISVFVKSLPAGSAVRIGAGGSSDSAPSWSPDGERIAFVRSIEGKSSIVLWVYKTGVERQLVEVGDVRSISWAPDGQHLVVSERSSFGSPYSLHRIDTTNGERKRLTWYSGIGFGDVDAVWSGDGQWIAFIRWEAAPASDLHLVGSQGGEVIQLTRERRSMFGVAWVPGSDELIFGSDREGMQTLWRARIRTTPFALRPPQLEGLPQRVAEAGDYANHPSVARLSNKSLLLVFQRLVRDFNIWRAQLGRGDPQVARTVRSTRWDFTPDLSPDGKKLAFASDRTGNMEIWVSNADGSNPRQITSAPGFYSRVPKWSPDGRSIVFDSRGQGLHGDILVAEVDSGKIRHLTDSPVNEVRPFWSADGEWVYFRSDEGGLETLWKVEPGGGKPVQVLREPIYEALESLDGKALYFTRRAGDGLWKSGPNGEAPTLISPDVRTNCWALSRAGIFYFPQNNASPVSWRLPGHVIFLLRPGTANPEQVLSTDAVLGLDSPLISTSSDGTQLVWSQADTYIDDLVLVKNFR